MSSSTMLPPQERLDSLIDVLDRHESATGGHTIFRVVDHPDHFTVDRIELEPGEHPCLLLLGLTAEDNWWAVGVRAHGRAHKLDEDMKIAGHDPSPMRVSYLVARTGDEATLLHIGDVTHRNPGESLGKLADLCRRVLGLATDPPPAGPGLLWTLMWLDRVLRRGYQPSWSAIAALHPAFDDTRAGTDRGRPDVVGAGLALAERYSWHDLRHWARPVPLPPYACELMPPDGPWFDDGSYARWTLGSFRSLDDLAVEACELLGELHGDRLLQCLSQLVGTVPSTTGPGQPRDRAPRSGRG